MRVLTAVLLTAVLLPGLAHAQAIIVSPGYPGALYPGGGFAAPYPPVMPASPGVSPFSAGIAAGAYPPGAQTCVAAEQACPAPAPNTVGNRCSCPGRDGRPSFGIVH